MLFKVISRMFYSTRHQLHFWEVGVTMAKLFWLRFLILFCIAACLVSESVAFGNIYKGGHGRKLTRPLRKVSIDL